MKRGKIMTQLLFLVSWFFGRYVTSKYIYMLYDKQGVIGTMDTTTTIFEIVHINVYM